jgi:hypothetical protein
MKIQPIPKKLIFQLMLTLIKIVGNATMDIKKVEIVALKKHPTAITVSLRMLTEQRELGSVCLGIIVEGLVVLMSQLMDMHQAIPLSVFQATKKVETVV